MDKAVVLTIVEFIAGLILEGVILGFIFQQISNKSQAIQEQALQKEMNTIEKQNKFDYEQITKAIQDAKIDIISQIKESEDKR